MSTKKFFLLLAFILFLGIISKSQDTIRVLYKPFYTDMVERTIVVDSNGYAQMDKVIYTVRGAFYNLEGDLDEVDTVTLVTRKGSFIVTADYDKYGYFWIVNYATKAKYFSLFEVFYYVLNN